MAIQTILSILDLLFFIEDSLLDNLEEDITEKIQKESFIPTIKKIDTNNFDTKAIWLSVQQTQSAISSNNKNKKSESKTEKTIRNKDSQKILQAGLKKK